MLLLSIYLNHLLPDYLQISYQTIGLSDNQDGHQNNQNGRQNGRHLSVYTCGHSNLVIYHPIFFQISYIDYFHQTIHI